MLSEYFYKRAGVGDIRNRNNLLTGIYLRHIKSRLMEYWVSGNKKKMKSARIVIAYNSVLVNN